MMDLERKFEGASSLSDFVVPVTFAGIGAKVGSRVGKGRTVSLSGAGGACSEYTNCSGDMGQLRLN